jgi:hypothetical protein
MFPRVGGTYWRLLPTTRRQSLLRRRIQAGSCHLPPIVPSWGIQETKKCAKSGRNNKKLLMNEPKKWPRREKKKRHTNVKEKTMWPNPSHPRMEIDLVVLVVTARVVRVVRVVVVPENVRTLQGCIVRVLVIGLRGGRRGEDEPKPPRLFLWAYKSFCFLFCAVNRQ